MNRKRVLVPVKGTDIPTANMYVITDEIFGPGDWVYEYVDVGLPPYEGEVYQVLTINEEEGIVEFEDHTVGIGFCKKVIESSNPKLNLPSPIKISKRKNYDDISE